MGMDCELYPSAIADLETKGLALKNRAQSLKDKLDTIKNQFMSEIASAVDENGKKMFSNAEAREIELAKRLQEDGKYQSLLNQLSDIENERAENEIALDKIKAEFSVERYKLRLRTAEQIEQASKHFVEGLKIVAGLGNLISQLAQQSPPIKNTIDDIDFDDIEFV